MESTPQTQCGRVATRPGAGAAAPAPRRRIRNGRLLTRRPPVRRRMLVLQLHGIQSHPGWFGRSAAAMATAGHPAYQVTRRGSGENAAARGDAPSAARLLADIDETCRFVLDRHGCKQLHMVGISWGGKLAACHAAGRGKQSRRAVRRRGNAGLADAGSAGDIPVRRRLNRHEAGHCVFAAGPADPDFRDSAQRAGVVH